MFRLVALLCAAMLLTLMIAGNDHGQTRPGLERAKANGEEIIEITRSFSPIVELNTPEQSGEQPLSALPPPIELAAAPTIASVPRDAPVSETAAEEALPTFTLSTVTEAQKARIAAAASANLEVAQAEADRLAQLEAARKARDESVVGLLEPLEPPFPADPAGGAMPSEDGSLPFGTTAPAPVDPFAAQPDAANPAPIDPYSLDPGAVDPSVGDPGLDDPGAYVSIDPLTGADIPQGLAGRDIRVVDATSVNVRLDPNGEAAVIGKLFAGEMVQVMGAPNSEWVEVYLESEGLRGYVATRLLSGPIY